MDKFKVEVAEVVVGLSRHLFGVGVLDKEHGDALDYICPGPSGSEVD